MPKLRSGKIGESNISLAGISMLRKSDRPMAFRGGLLWTETVPGIRFDLRPGITWCRIFFRFCSMKLRGVSSRYRFRIPSLKCCQLLFRLGLNSVNGLPPQSGFFCDCGYRNPLAQQFTDQTELLARECRFPSSIFCAVIIGLGMSYPCFLRFL